LLGVLVAWYLLQGAIVYTDWPRREPAWVLSPPAARGLALWRRENCQACHQLHGLGGFLGPDLTNVAARRTPDELAEVLLEGRRQMPAFALGSGERADLGAFLAEMDRTGLAQASLPARRRRALPPARQGASAGHGATSGAGPEPPEFDFARRGLALPAARSSARRLAEAEELVSRSGCASCHVPFGVGRVGAPDLTLALSWRGEPEARALVRDGRGAMPAYGHLSDRDLDLMVHYLEWLRDRRADLGAAVWGPLSFGPGEVPWFEFR
jgi:nitric oxide reductase subunit C